MRRNLMHAPLFLAVDVGMSGVKAGLFAASGDCVLRHSVTLGVHSPRAGWGELDLEEVWQAVTGAVRQVCGTRGSNGAIAGIGLSVASPTVVVTDLEGKPLCGALTYSDSRARPRLEEVRDCTEEERYFRITGNRLELPMCSAASMLHQVDALGHSLREVRVGHLNSYLAYCLTGRWVMDWTNASFTGLVDIREPDKWSREACEIVKFPPESLPELVAPYEPLGGLTVKAASDLGLERSVTVVAGAADTACSAYGVGCVEEGDVFESVGTSGVLTFCHAAPPENRLFMNRSHVLPRRWLSHGAMSAVGASIGWLQDELFPELSEGTGEAGFSRLAAEATASEAGAGGVVFLPYLMGERTPVWDSGARGAWVGLSTRTGRPQLVRAVFESAGYGLRQILEIGEGFCHREIDEILLVGGGARSRFWTGMKADIMGRSYRRAEETETASLGAALLCAVGAGVYADVWSAPESVRQLKGENIAPTQSRTEREIYDRRYRVYLALYRAQKDALAEGNEEQQNREQASTQTGVLNSLKESM